MKNLRVLEREKNFMAVRRSPSPDNTRGITIASAKYTSEDVATLVEYTIAIVEYTRLCGPLKAALERSQELQREIAENERLQKEKDNQVSSDSQPNDKYFFNIVWAMQTINVVVKLKVSPSECP